MGGCYRVRQGMARLVTCWRPPDVALARETLTPLAMSLFDTMSPSDQGHAIAVLRCLRLGEPVSRDLAAAALLHDVGKAGSGLTLPYRTAIVLLEAFWPGALARLCVNAQGTWRQPFAVDARHADIGAERCARAGCSQRTVTLVRCHDTPPGAVLAEMRVELERLRRADDQN